MQLTAQSCELFDIPFFQFSQLKKYCPEDIPLIKARYKAEWENWKKIHLAVHSQLGALFAKPHIEKWCNGWQVRAHFFAYYKLELNQYSAVILSVILNRRRLSVRLDWHSYRANRSLVSLHQYNQWLDKLNRQKYANFDIWRNDESEYANFRTLKELSPTDLILNNQQDFYCIGKNIEKKDLSQIDPVEFIYQTIFELLPLYNQCHK
ncbi:hypothetical protein A6B43_06215 [Vespertiliibacter pulmonis]|uniref:Glucose-6-phosphate dehydrogenase-like protein n=1 Tax=Vespertiliibacter pulmonis TaxID=1443036 RepID=A0A3N4VQA2_9PAST|nr:HI_0552 family protein [Vespertiliibacter pulmonis]QLB21143.1 hypothetical protein A6B43_06215 [Vespertiliibacter pulmonis]RPE83753.1 glucose-6-phosphate dehydrogenase-like protein [Vespertiliibacter pulmonis]